MSGAALTECDPLNKRIFLKRAGLWGELAPACLQTREMQRLHRVKQLGFADFVFRSASHSRLIHSLGVYHMARRLTGVIRQEVPEAVERACEIAELAALVHDVGHGPFSHVFERALASLGRQVDHARVSAAILQDPETELGAALAAADRELPDELAELVAGPGGDLYSAIVASAFDADRLDYVRRDSLMAGTEFAALDLEWLLATLTVAELPPSSRRAGRLGFVLDLKGLHALESYLLSRFHLYERVYLHPDTRGFEKLFVALIQRVAAHCADGAADSLPGGRANALVRYLADGDDSHRALLPLDDMSCFAGVMLLAESADPYLAELAQRLRDRRPLYVVDLSGGRRLASTDGLDDLLTRIDALARQHLGEEAERWFFIDQGTAKPFGSAEKEQTIYVRDDYGNIADARSYSSVLKHLQPRPILRAYVRDPGLVEPLQSAAERYWRGDLLV